MGTVKSSNRTPRQAEAIKVFFNTLTANMHTCLPCRVKAVNKSDNTVDVEACLMRKYKDTAAVKLPALLHVPRGVYSDGDAFVRLPCRVGSYGAVHFSERSIEKWYKKGGIVDPADVRRFDLSDAYFLPFLRPSTSPIASNGADDSIEIANGKTWVEITKDGKVKIGSDSAELLTLFDSLLSALGSAAITNPVNPNVPLSFIPPTSVQIAQIQQTLGNIKP